MRIKAKKFDEITCRHQTIGYYYVEETSLIGRLKDLVSKSISFNSSYFHFESYVLGCKVFLTESFP